MAALRMPKMQDSWRKDVATPIGSAPPTSIPSALLINPVNASRDFRVGEFKAAAASINAQTEVLSATTRDEIERR